MLVVCCVGARCWPRALAAHQGAARQTPHRLRLSYCAAPARRCARRSTTPPATLARISQCLRCPAPADAGDSPVAVLYRRPPGARCFGLPWNPLLVIGLMLYGSYRLPSGLPAHAFALPAPSTPRLRWLRNSTN
ncbi:MAG: hypothetical protein MZV70_46860 [Desulfobacterales bacterium]|nr:hypothetical protein [Desulfobacterales bacterium]